MLYRCGTQCMHVTGTSVWTYCQIHQWGLVLRAFYQTHNAALSSCPGQRDPSGPGNLGLSLVTYTPSTLPRHTHTFHTGTNFRTAHRSTKAAALPCVSDPSCIIPRSTVPFGRDRRHGRWQQRPQASLPVPFGRRLIRAHAAGRRARPLRFRVASGQGGNSPSRVPAVPR